MDTHIILLKRKALVPLNITMHLLANIILPICIYPMLNISDNPPTVLYTYINGLIDIPIL